MIKSICFDLGEGKELYLTLEEIAKLQQAFRIVALDNYTTEYKFQHIPNPPPPIYNPFPTSDIDEQPRKAREAQERANNHFNKGLHG